MTVLENGFNNNGTVCGRAGEIVRTTGTKGRATCGSQEESLSTQVQETTGSWTSAPQVHIWRMNPGLLQKVLGRGNYRQP